MARILLILKLVLATIALGAFFNGQLIEAASPAMSETAANQEAVRRDDTKGASGGRGAIQLSQDEIDSIAAALPEGEARQIFKEKAAKGEDNDDASFDETLRSGEGFTLIFFKGEKAFSRVSC